MNRRELMSMGAACLYAGVSPASARGNDTPSSVHRFVGPDDPSWPSEGMWSELSQQVGGRLVRLGSPFE